MFSSFRVREMRAARSILSHGERRMSTVTLLKRSYLYVPCSSDRMLEKSITVGSDIITYDLEDSVSPAIKDKENARSRLRSFLKRDDLPDPRHLAVRVNDIQTPFFREDIAQIISVPSVRSLILPKIHSADDLDYVSNYIHAVFQSSGRIPTLDIIPSIESAKGMWNLGNIANWVSKHGPESGGKLSALLFAAEDYCADTGILRTRSRRELLYTRSQIVIAAKAFGLGAIDMVCVNYRDLENLRDECLDARELGFTGKQAIHPTQVKVIQSTFVPTEQEIIRAAKIVQKMKNAHESEKGAVGLDGEMIDAPMLKQAQKTIDMAEAAGLPIPKFTE